jgi:uncharacterized protein (TIGR02271 family)
MLRKLLALFGMDVSVAEQVAGVTPSSVTEADTGSPSVFAASPPDHPTFRANAANLADSSLMPDDPEIIGQNGESYRLLQRSNDGQGESLLLIREDGAQITVFSSELTRQDSGNLLLTDAVRDRRGLVIPVVEEQVELAKQQVETGRVRISKTVESRDVVVDEPLRRERVSVEHVPLNQVVTGDVPKIREEGDVTVIPILEERLVTRTELVLVEEVRIRREHSEYHDPQTVTLRKEVVNVERLGEAEINLSEDRSA